MDTIEKTAELIRFLNRAGEYGYAYVGNRKETKTLKGLLSEENQKGTTSRPSNILIFIMNKSEHVVPLNYLKSIKEDLHRYPFVIFVESSKRNPIAYFWALLQKQLFSYTSLFDFLESQYLLKGVVSTPEDKNKSRIYIAGKYAVYKKMAKKLRVLATICLYNESDIIGQTVKYLVDQGIDVHVIDNWSTDGSYELVKNLTKKYKNVSLERFPRDKKPKYYEWINLLKHVEEIAKKSKYDWVIHYDSDEIRQSPWPDINLQDGIAFVDSLGFNAIDFTVLNFRFTKSTSGFSKNKEPLSYFKYCEFGNDSAEFIQVKAWKNRGQKVDLAGSGGHNATFEGREVFPIKFLTRHYSLRSKNQATKKLFRDRFPRFSPEELKRGFHSHYNQYKTNNQVGFDEKSLINAKSKNFQDNYFIELISGVGVKIVETIPNSEKVMTAEEVMSLRKELNEYKEILENIRSAKFFRLWQSYCHVRDSFLASLKK